MKRYVNAWLNGAATIGTIYFSIAAMFGCALGMLFLALGLMALTVATIEFLKIMPWWQIIIVALGIPFVIGMVLKWVDEAVEGWLKPRTEDADAAQ